MSKIVKGDIWLVDNTGAQGHVIKGIRPHVVVTKVSGATVSVVPCSSQSKRKKYPHVVEVLPSKHNGLSVTSYAVIAQTFAADISFFKKKLGTLEPEKMKEIQLEYVKYVTE